MWIAFVVLYIWAGFTLTASQWATIKDLEKDHKRKFPMPWLPMLIMNFVLWPLFPFFIWYQSSKD